MKRARDAHAVRGRLVSSNLPFPMPLLIVILAALSTGALGLVGTGLLAAGCVRWYSISSFEGGSGYFVVGLALVGGLLGLLLGAGGSLVGLFATERFAGWSALPLAWALAVGALLFATALAWFCSLPRRVPDGTYGTLEIEALLPEGLAAPSASLDGESLVDLAAQTIGATGAVCGGHVEFDKARRERDRWIVPVVLHVRIRRDEETRLAALDTAARTVHPIGRLLDAGNHPLEWSAWVPSDPPPPGFACRHRPRVHAPSERDSAAPPATIDTLDPDAPLSAWLGMLDRARDEPQRRAAIDAIAARPLLAETLGALAVADDGATAAAALRAVPLLPPDDDAWRSLLASAGTDIARRVERAASAPVADDPSFELAADAGMRFAAWMHAVRALRERDAGACDAALAPILLAILEQSRRRPESRVLRHDVCRVASFYALEWTGAPPHPDDPAPR